ncbi:MAG: DNA gyrase inhibitor YacG [Planctomycetales bacterium]|nr:DNA gyrase inhibitor YacG [Planctomycetales bacterium]
MTAGESCRACGKPLKPGGSGLNRFYPFCSELCSLRDLGKWVEGDYRIPGPPLPPPPPQGEDEEA